MKKQLDNTEIEELKKQIEDWKAKYMRALADYQNLERRVSRDSQEIREQISREILHGVLVVLDDIQRAQHHIKDEGLSRALQGFDRWLALYNVTPIDVLHKQFNPHEMECVEVIESDKENEVVEVVRTGYTMGNTMLRPALVKVGKKKEATLDTSANKQINDGSVQ